MMSIAPGYLLDSNILLRYADKNSPQHLVTSQAILLLSQSTVKLCIAPQNIYEFWNVATRPAAVNGLGFTATETNTLVNYFKAAFQLLPETPGVYAEWERLVKEHNVIGKQAHDCRLVAFMKVHGLSHLLTFNGNDFRRFETAENVRVVEPSSITAPPNGSTGNAS